MAELNRIWDNFIYPCKEYRGLPVIDFDVVLVGGVVVVVGGVVVVVAGVVMLVSGVD